MAPGFCPVSDCRFRHENTARKGGATKILKLRGGPCERHPQRNFRHDDVAITFTRDSSVQTRANDIPIPLSAILRQSRFSLVPTGLIHQLPSRGQSHSTIAQHRYLSNEILLLPAKITRRPIVIHTMPAPEAGNPRIATMAPPPSARYGVCRRYVLWFLAIALGFGGFALLRYGAEAQRLSIIAQHEKRRALVSTLWRFADGLRDRVAGIACSRPRHLAALAVQQPSKRSQCSRNCV